MSNYGLNLPTRKAIVVHLWVVSNIVSLTILSLVPLIFGIGLGSLYAVFIFIVLQHWTTWVLKRWIYGRKEHDASNPSA